MALLCGALFPLVAIEGWTRAAPEVIWRLADTSGVRSPTRHGLVAEAVLSRWRHEGGAEVVVVGNSVARWATNELLLSAGIDGFPKVSVLHLNHLTPVEAAMLAGDLAAASPRVVIYMVTRWGAVSPVQLESLRFLDLHAARQLMDAATLWKEHAHLLSLLARSQFFLLRHARPILEISGEQLGLPLWEMLSVVPDEPWLGTDLEETVFPTTQTPALRFLARQLRQAEIPFVLVSPPVGMDSDPGRLTDAQARRHKEVQGAMDEWLTRMAEEEGFLYLASARFGLYDPSSFQDPVHLGPAGQARFSMALAPFVDALLEAAP
jgi:hypothetical protein